MSDLTRLVCSQPLERRPVAWCKLAPLGEWKGHPQVGRQAVTPERAQSIVDCFASDYRANATDLVVDYNHATLLALSGRIPPDQAIAAGWTKEIELRDGEPWGRIDWTPAAEARIAHGEFRYLSPVFEFNVPDRKTGEIVPARLHSIALTNKPFFTELPAVANIGEAFASLLSDPSDSSDLSDPEHRTPNTDHPSHTRPVAFVGFSIPFLLRGAEPWAIANPYPSEHAARVEDPGKFDQFRRKEITSGISIILGKKKNDPSRDRQGADSSGWEVQAYRFDKKKFTPDEAKKWLKEHQIAGDFEAASEEATNQAGVRGSVIGDRGQEAEHRTPNTDHPVSLSPAAPAAQTLVENDMDLKKMAKLLGLAEDAAEPAVEAKLAETVAAANAARPLLAPNVAELLGVPLAADLAAIQAKIAEIKSPLPDGRGSVGNPQSAIPNPQFDHVAVANSLGLESKASLEDVLKSIGALKSSAASTAAEKLVANAVAERRIPPADRQHWLDEAKRDFPRAERLIANMRPLIAPVLGGHGRPADDGLPTLTAEELTVARQLHLDPATLAKEKAKKN